MKRLKCALACAALSLFGLGAAGTSGEFSGTWTDAWNDASRPGETTDFAEGGLAADFDSRVAGIGASESGEVDSRVRDSEESAEGHLDSRPPSGLAIFVR